MKAKNKKFIQELVDTVKNLECLVIDEAPRFESCNEMQEAWKLLDKAKKKGFPFYDYGMGKKKERNRKLRDKNLQTKT